MENSKVVVGIVTYNRYALLRKSINSILSQDYQNIEIIVLDDASTDETSEIGVDFPMINYIKSNIKSDEESELNLLTKSGKVCIQADLESDKQLEWTQRMAQFLWKAKWITKSGLKITMQNYLERNLPAPKPFEVLQER